MNEVHFGDNLNFLRTLENESISLIYIDPPFNTGKAQQLHSNSYSDSFENLQDFLRPRLVEAKRVLKPNGSLYFHIDYRESHYCKILLDEVFGRASFLNEVIWAYDYGGRSKKKWAQKHDTILVYAKDPDNYVFNYDEIDRVPYMAPGLVGPEKAAKGKPVTSVWWMTIVHTNGKERTGYPTQKPIKLLKRLIKVSSNPGDTVLDFFAGSGTTGAACLDLNRQFILVDQNKDAIEVMRKRFADCAKIIFSAQT